MAYQPRQLLPFVAVFVASFLLAVFESARLYIRSRQLKYIPILLGGMISILFFKILYTDPLRHSLEYHLHDGFTLRVPVETKFKKLAVDLGAELRGDKVLIQVGEYFPAINRFLGHAQVHPAIEFYFDGPVLSFQDLAELKRDILTLQSLPFDSTQLVLFFPKQLNSQIRKLLDYKKIHWKPWKSFNDHESLIAIVHGNARD